MAGLCFRNHHGQYVFALGSENISVAMGAVSQRGSLSRRRRFRMATFAIDLQNCGSTASGVTVSFSGAADSRNTDLWRLPRGKRRFRHWDCAL